MNITDVIYKTEVYGVSHDFYSDTVSIHKDEMTTNKKLAFETFESMVLECESEIKSDYFTHDEDLYDINIIPNIDFLQEQEITEDNVLKHYQYEYNDYVFYVKITTHTVEEILNLSNDKYVPVIHPNHYQIAAEKYL